MSRPEIKLHDTAAEQYARVLIDSGAHSYNKVRGNVTSIGGRARAVLPEPSSYMKQYEEFVLSRGIKNVTYVELDIYHLLGYEAISASVARMRARGARVLRVYHPTIDDSSLSTIARWMEVGEQYVGLARDSIRLFDQIFKRFPGVRFHGFAVTELAILERYPFYSADSTTAIATARYGGILLPRKYLSVKAPRWRHTPMMHAPTPARIAHCVTRFMQWEQYITELWKRRGIEWPENKQTERRKTRV